MRGTEMIGREAEGGEQVAEGGNEERGRSSGE